MTSSSIKQTDRGHPCARRMRLRCGDEVAKCRLETFAESLERFEVDLCALALWPSLEGAHIFDDRSDRVDDALHRLQYTSGCIRPTGCEQAVNRGNEAGDVDVDETTIARHRKLVIDLGRLQV